MTASSFTVNAFAFSVLLLLQAAAFSQAADFVHISDGKASLLPPVAERVTSSELVCRINNEYASPLDCGAIIEENAAKYSSCPQVDRVALTECTIHAESGGRIDAVGYETPDTKKFGRARGLMQLLPSTAARYGVRASQIADPSENIRAGMAYHNDLLQMFGCDVTKTVAGYIAGEGRVQQYGGVPPASRFPQTVAYVRKVGSCYNGKTSASQQRLA